MRLSGGEVVAEGSKARDMLNYAFLTALADDGIIDESELLYIRSLALADGLLDEGERRALTRIFALVDEAQLSTDAQEEFRKFRRQYNL